MIDRARPVSGEHELFVELGRTRIAHADADKLGGGSAVTLDTLVDEPVNILVGGRVIAQGEVLELDGNFSIRVTKLLAAGSDAR